MRAEDLQAERIEPLNRYGILTNDDGQIMLLLPGYFRGEPALYRRHGARYGRR